MTRLAAVLLFAFAGCTPDCPPLPDLTLDVRPVALEAARQVVSLDSVIAAVTTFAESHGQVHEDHEDPDNPEGVALQAVLEALEAASDADRALVFYTERLAGRLEAVGLVSRTP